jgi:hypothetical protein
MLKSMLRCLTLVAVLSASPLALAAEGTWEEAASVDIGGRKLIVSARSKEGSDIKEVRGVGVIDAPAWVVKNVIDDVAHYKDFMPYTKASTVISTHDGYVVSYQRLATPVVDDRDYTIKIFDESREDAQGKVIWKTRWTEANKLGPKPIDGVARVPINEGYWILEDADGGARTRATYYVYTSPGGSIPTFVVNMANAQAVPELFRAVGKASKDPRYQAARPKPRSSEKTPPVPLPSVAATPAPQAPKP